MKDIKITKENYRELFECAGFDEVSKNIFSIATSSCYLRLRYNLDERTVAAWASSEENADTISLNRTNNSTAEIDRLFYPFLDNPLVWEKKWDFDSVFEREYGNFGIPDSESKDILNEYFCNPNPRVQAFSRLLLVMNELNEEYEQIAGCFRVAPNLDGRISVVIHNVNVLNSLFCFSTRKAANLFIRDNEEALNTFFNI